MKLKRTAMLLSTVQGDVLYATSGSLAEHAGTSRVVAALQQLFGEHPRQSGDILEFSSVGGDRCCALALILGIEDARCYLTIVGGEESRAAASTMLYFARQILYGAGMTGPIANAVTALSARSEIALKQSTVANVREASTEQLHEQEEKQNVPVEERIDVGEDWAARLCLRQLDQLLMQQLFRHESWYWWHSKRLLPTLCRELSSHPSAALLLCRVYCPISDSGDTALTLEVLFTLRGSDRQPPKPALLAQVAAACCKEERKGKSRDVGVVEADFFALGHAQAMTTAAHAPSSKEKCDEFLALLMLLPTADLENKTSTTRGDASTRLPESLRLAWLSDQGIIATIAAPVETVRAAGARSVEDALTAVASLVAPMPASPVIARAAAAVVEAAIKAAFASAYASAAATATSAALASASASASAASSAWAAMAAKVAVGGEGLDRVRLPLRIPSPQQSSSSGDGKRTLSLLDQRESERESEGEGAQRQEEQGDYTSPSPTETPGAPPNSPMERILKSELMLASLNRGPPPSKADIAQFYQSLLRKGDSPKGAEDSSGSFSSPVSPLPSKNAKAGRVLKVPAFSSSSPQQRQQQRQHKQEQQQQQQQKQKEGAKEGLLRAAAPTAPPRSSLRTGTRPAAGRLIVEARPV